MMMADMSPVQPQNILEEGIKVPARNKINSQMMPTSVISTKYFTLFLLQIFHSLFDKNTTDIG